MKRSGWALLVILGLGVFAVLAEQIDRGVVMRPVRKLAAKVGVQISPPTLTPEEKAEARELAKQWKAECLEKYPELKVTAKPVPLEENGFWLLWQLDQEDAPSRIPQALAKGLWEFNEGPDLELAKRLLEVEEHRNWVAHIENIADLTGQSNLGLPEEYNGFVGARAVKQASDALLMRACLAASEDDGAGAFEDVRRVGRLATHLRDVEAPFLLSEMVVILMELGRQRVALKHILPELGAACDLALWREELDCRQSISPQRFAQLLRGEWDTNTRHMAYPLLAQCDVSGEIADGRSYILAYVDWIVKQARMLEAIEKWSEVPAGQDVEAQLRHLSGEALEVMSVLCVDEIAWGKGFRRSQRLTALSLAALDLLMLEKEQGAITPAEMAKCMRDPLTGEPFLFDPDARTVSAAEVDGADGIDPLELPW